jgi:DNA polymerase III sliding clamp (beta) subunit (PCNA family)
VTRVRFENATIRDVIGKASKIAPTRGSAFDKAAGILMEVDAAKKEVIVRSTNLEVFYMEIVDAVEIEGESCKWLLPSELLNGICGKLPVKSGATTDFEADGREMRLSQGRMRARLRLADPTYYPEWKAFNPADLSPVDDFGGRLQQVQWAASKTGVAPLTGIHLTGAFACATDNYRVAMTPCAIEQLYEPVTIPSATFTPLMKSMGEVKIGLEEGMLLVMPDDTTQIRAVIYPQKYHNIIKLFKREEPQAIIIQRDDLLEMIEQAMVIGSRDRAPLLKMILGCEELAILMEDQEVGLLGNVLDIAAQATHDRHYIGFTPDNLVAGLRASPNNQVTMWYTFGAPMKPVRIDGGSGYEVLIMPRDLNKKEEATS